MAQKKAIERVRITQDTFINGVPVSAGTVVGMNEKIHATEQQMKDLIAYRKAEESKAPAQSEAGKAGK